MIVSQRPEQGRLISKRLGMRLLASAAALASVSTAHAQDQQPVPDTDAMEEIVVTAQRRSESVQDVPISISAFSGEALEETGIRRLADIRQNTPNLYFEDNGGVLSGEPVVRGITSSGAGISFEPAVGVYLDGVFLGRPTLFSQELFDIERVEVLRGPQGTLYGRNTLGGAINIISRKPGNELEGAVRGYIGNYDTYRVSGFVSGPVIPDKLSIGAAGGYSERDGYKFNEFTGSDIGDNSNRSARLTLRATPSHRFTFDLAFDISHDKGSATQIEDAIGPGTDPSASFPVGILFGYQEQDPFDRRISFDTTPIEDLKQWGVSGVAELDLGSGASLTSITAYRKFTNIFLSDIDRTETALITGGFTEKTDQFSQELRVATSAARRLSFVGGLYYFTQDANDDANLTLGADLNDFFAAVVGAPPGTFQEQVNTTLSRVQTDSYAAFGEGTFKLTDQLHFSVGGRYSHEKKALTLEQGVTGTPFSIFPLIGFFPFEPFQQKYKESDFSPSLSVRYFAGDDVLIYGRVAKGFKAGGFNARFPATNPDGTVEDLSFDAETLWSYELGAKLDLFRNRLRINGAVFYMEHSDKQVTSFDGVSDRTDNAAKARSKGFELELTARPIPNLDLSAGIGYNDSKYVDYLGGLTDPDDPTSPLIDYSGNRVAGAPDWTVNTAVQYGIPVGRGEVRLRGEYSYIGEIINDIDADPDLTENGYSLVNALITWAPSESVEVSALIRNAFNEKYISTAFSLVPTTGLKHINLGAPRTYGVAARVKF
jgi:iron complex outermembrane receptor protein